MEDLVKRHSSAQDYLEVASIIERFLNGTGNRWDWDDFIHKRRFKDPYLSQIRFQCDAVSWSCPALVFGQYCNQDGLVQMRCIIEELRQKADEKSLASLTLGSRI